MASNRDNARQFLSDANDAAGDAKREDYSLASALIGIGYSVLALADTISGVKENDGEPINNEPMMVAGGRRREMP